MPYISDPKSKSMFKKIVCILGLFLSMVSCSSSDDTSAPATIGGLTYEVESVFIDVPIDVNNDGIWSNNLMEEVPECFTRTIRFLGSGKADNPAVNNVISFAVNFDFSGNPTSQSAACRPITNFPLTNFTQAGNAISLFNDGSPVFIVGTASADLSRVEFDFTFQNFAAQSFNGTTVPRNEILNQNGTVTEYTGNIRLVYRRQ